MKILASVALILLAEAIVAVGDVLSKRWQLGLGTIYLFGGAACYVTVTLSWFGFLRLHGDLGRAGALWASSGVIVPALVGWLYFKEPMGATKTVGVILSTLGMLFAAL